MKHLVASSIAAPSVPCFSPQSLLSLLYVSGTLHSKNLVYGTACIPTFFVAKTCIWCFSHQTWVLLRWTKTELNGNLSTCAENQSLLQSLQTAALLARCKFCFQGTKNGTQRKSMNDKNHETCAKKHRDRRKWS